MSTPTSPSTAREPFPVATAYTLLECIVASVTVVIPSWSSERSLLELPFTMEVREASRSDRASNQVALATNMGARYYDFPSLA